MLFWCKKMFTTSMRFKGARFRTLQFLILFPVPVIFVEIIYHRFDILLFDRGLKDFDHLYDLLLPKLS